MSGHFSKLPPIKYLIFLLIVGLVFAIANPKTRLPSVKGLASIRGLKAKLEAAELQISKGNNQAALKISEGFYREINALQSAEKIDTDTYNNFYDEYSILVTELGEIPSPPSIWEIQYDADALPEEADLPWTKDSFGSATAVIEDGKLHFYSPNGLYHIWYELLDESINLATGFTVEARIRLISDGGALPGEYYSYFDMGDADQSGTLLLREDGLELILGYDTPAIGFYSMNTTDDYHIYRVVIKGTTAILYVDGVKQLEVTGGTGGAYGFVSFCDAYAKAGAIQEVEHYWDYLFYETRGAFSPDEFPYKHPGLTR